MNAKALIQFYIDYPTDQRLQYTVQVAYIGSSGQGFLGTHVVDAVFTETDTIAQIKTKIRNAIIAHASTLGYTVAAADVGSIMQI